MMVVPQHSSSRRYSCVLLVGTFGVAHAYHTASAAWALQHALAEDLPREGWLARRTDASEPRPSRLHDLDTTLLGKSSHLTSSHRLLPRPLARWPVPRPQPSLRLACRAVQSWKAAADRDGIEFVKGYRNAMDMPFSQLPEVALAGRSNVGKSTALNALSGKKKKVAVTGKTPGRTQMLNLFKVGKACSLVDLPGYGFAKASKQKLDDWKRYITNYLRARQNLKLVVLFVDVQREPQESDGQLLTFLEFESVPYLVVATKCDKLKPAEIKKNLKTLNEGLSLPKGQPLPFSGATKEGVSALWVTALHSRTS
eukprot:gnl/TRDRNA2_/TRDRNA2_134764_c0_seq2.p1 gnl/TRDRNA2_/TRDRNA2_134764_c0~~gnl/TRDRNA2_/TRDRNA2_134764_c0_seq2.p1  ORF type:complete len:311 (+),score=36.03 gnl/TRDRNA2_/TRDRNA2_134764_c0_seq2:45-977(+)